jgi:hypothetical protein
MNYNDHYTKHKVELLEKYDNSRDIVQVMQDAVDLYFDVSNHDSLAVDEEPFGAGWNLELALSLLNDLVRYNRHYRCDDTIPDDLAYIKPYFNDEADDDDDVEDND